MVVRLGALTRLVAIVCGLGACDAADTTRYEDLERPLLERALESNPVCIQLIVIDAANTLWHGSACEAALVLHRVRRVDEAELDAVATAFWALPPGPDTTSCRLLDIGVRGERYTFSVVARAESEQREVCVAFGEMLAEPWKTAAERFEALLEPGVGATE